MGPASTPQPERIRTITDLDLRLGLVQLTPEQRERLTQAALPVLVRAAVRVYREMQQQAIGQVGAGD